MRRTGPLLALALLALAPTAAQAEFLVDTLTYDLAADDPDAIDFSIVFNQAFDPDSVPYGSGPPRHALILTDGLVDRTITITTAEIRTRGTIVVRDGNGVTGNLLAEAVLDQPSPELLAFRLPRFLGAGAFDLLRVYSLVVTEHGIITQYDGVSPGIINTFDPPPPDPSVTPEPASLAMAAFGIVVLAGRSVIRGHRRRSLGRA